MRKATPLRLAIVASERKQKDVAEDAGLTESRLSQIVNGHWNADEATRARIANALGKTPAELWPETDDQVAA